ncbi:MAG: P-II family nitrogen regulator, partial [Gammaproteobacteria bacterium]|nr:P-II family nitrogen regulator [Gammaproteobacteria bacterium]
MHFKLIVVVVDDKIANDVAKAARDAGATGVTLISTARGEGMTPQKTFLGLSMETQRDEKSF